ncbi:NAD(+) synthase [Pelagibacterium luteolum]|uniref:NH(3)-dependent NAD(+) synthetase n=1 Tax=Pelagibacterium luteolum TaxID=440168 RepID=A0A1G8A5Z7_9HYPH|nr:NAD(+) synthase [Pelagibacterium luteolum]SDH16303.1 nicotinamide-nucleotide amidase [Pelagibacterium luteolum]
MQHLDEILELSRQTGRGQLSPWFDARLHAQVRSGHFLPRTKLEAVGQRLVGQMSDYRQQAGIATAVLGMSGGVDSAVTAALLKQAGWRVIGYTLPIEQEPSETERGIEACRELGLEHVHIDLTEQYQNMVAAMGKLDAALQTSHANQERTRRGNVRARLRMITLYDQAHRWGGLVASTDNFSELGAGFWTLHGDVGDVAPVQALSKSWEIPWMARRYGVPESIWRATPTDGLNIGDGDEAQIGASYLQWDITVFAVTDALRENPSLTESELEVTLDAQQDPAASSIIATVLRKLRATWSKRVNPIALAHPASDRLGMLDRIDTRFFRPAVLRDDRVLSAFPAETAAAGWRLVQRLKNKSIRLVTAESCTAGLLGACVAAEPRSSDVLEGSFITYRPSMKVDVLGVSETLIKERTVYDPDVAAAMAKGALREAEGADLAIAITGVAGPEPDQGKPVGLVYIATQIRGDEARVTECRFQGAPEHIISAAIRKALEMGLVALA